MRRLQLGLAVLALPALALTLFVTGCGDSKKSDTGVSSSGGGEQKETATTDVKVLEPKGGVLKGKITLKGSPDVSALNARLMTQFDEKKQDKDECLKGSESEKTEQEYRLGSNNQLGNVFVWIKPEAGTFFKVDEKQLKELPKEVVIDQPHCAFIPHSAFLFSQYRPDPKSSPKPTGQTLKFKNGAVISHNTNWTGSRNKGDNVLLAAGKDRTVDNLVPEESPVSIKCNIHPWMDAYLKVVDTPYYAISHSDTLSGKEKVEKGDPKFGTYEIKNLPVGKVRVIAWHEKAGFLTAGGGKGDVIEIAEGKETTKDFEASAK
jgi:hypothetical protein